MKLFVRLAVSALLVLPVVATPAPAAAAPADDFRWSVVPSSQNGPNGRQHFEYELAAGGRVADWVSVSNLGKQPMTFTLYATDAFTAADGGFALRPASEEPTGAGSWITLRKKEFKVPAGKRADIPFELKVPANATPGDHIGGLVASIRQTEQQADGQRLEVERRVAARAYVRVAGPVQAQTSITALDVSYAAPILPAGRDMTVTYRVANDGNVRVSGNARIRVEGPLGMRVANSELIEIPELLPDSEIRIIRTIPGVLPAGHLTTSVSVNLTSAEGPAPSLTRSASAWAVPWALSGVLLAVAAAVAWRLVARRRRRATTGGSPFGDGPMGAREVAAT